MAKKTPESALRISIYVGVGLLAIYLSTWAGAVGFYFEFQKPLRVRAADASSMVWRSPDVVPPESAGDWQRDASGVVLPPGEVLASEARDGLRTVRLAGGDVNVSSFGIGFLGSLLAGEMERIGGELNEPLDDATALLEIARETPAAYRFSWPRERRERYAAHLLCKMLLWELGPTVRAELTLGPTGSAVLVENGAGETTVIVADASGVRVIGLDADAPEAWRRSPADWLALD